MTPIKVPKTPLSSFNKDRRPSTLLLDQIEHLEWAALPAWQRKPNLMKKRGKRRVKTEQQAAERIAQLTEIVIKASDEAPTAAGTRPTVVLPPLPRTTRTTKKRVTKKRPKTAKNPKKKKAARRRP